MELQLERSCINCGTIGCGHQEARKCGVGLWDWTPNRKGLELSRSSLDELESLKMLESLDAFITRYNY
jgi:hypothetical protein